MTDKPTLAKALKLAENPGSDEWLALLARMESPKPWRHNWKEKCPGTARSCGSICTKCGNVTLPDAITGDCPIPALVTEPLPCIVDRKMREIFQDPNWDKFCNAVTEVMGPDRYFHEAWFCDATPAQQLVCLWLVEGRLGK